MTQQFNKYFIGLIFAFCVIFIPNHNANADLVTSCTPLYGGCYTVAPLLVSVSLNGSTFSKDSDITANAFATFTALSDTTSYQVFVKGSTNNQEKTLIDTIENGENGTYTGNVSVDGHNVYYLDLSGNSNFTAPSTIGSYEFTYSGYSKQAIYETQCTSGHMVVENDGREVYVCTEQTQVLNPYLGETTATVSGTIPYNVVNPPTMTFTVTKADGTPLSVSQDDLRRTSPALQKQTKVLIKYTPSGLSFPFYCDEPVSDKYSSGRTTTFTSQTDIDSNQGFEVTPASDTKYSVTCHN